MNDAKDAKVGTIECAGKGKAHSRIDRPNCKTGMHSNIYMYINPVSEMTAKTKPPLYQYDIQVCLECQQQQQVNH